MAGIVGSALEMIGNTPLVALDRVHPGPGRLLAKAEFMQPGGSVKDRAALAILRAARADGRLAPGAPVVEMTSGNMGAGLAVVCAVLGHPLVVTMSRGNSRARARMLEALGAEVILCDQVDGAPGQVTGADIAAAAEMARDLAAARGGFLVDQFHAPEGIAAHRDGTGAEILAGIRAMSGGRIDAWLASVGSGATFTGVAAALKAAVPGVLCLAVEPEGSEPLAGKVVTKARHLLQGTGYGVAPPLWDQALVDGTMAVGDAEASAWRRRLAHEEGLHAGFSAAANVCAASRLLASGRLGPEAVAVTVLCDTGLKY
jgi:cysteine synthase A